MKTLRKKFTKWYIKRGYEFGYDFTNVDHYSDGIFMMPCGMPESYFKCPWWVKPLLIFFSPSVYYIETFGKEIHAGFQAGFKSVTDEDKKKFQEFLEEVINDETNHQINRTVSSGYYD